MSERVAARKPGTSGPEVAATSQEKSRCEQEVSGSKDTEASGAPAGLPEPLCRSAGVGGGWSLRARRWQRRCCHPRIQRSAARPAGLLLCPFAVYGFIDPVLVGAAK